MTEFMNDPSARVAYSSNPDFTKGGSQRPEVELLLKPEIAGALNTAVGAVYDFGRGELTVREDSAPEVLSEMAFVRTLIERRGSTSKFLDRFDRTERIVQRGLDEHRTRAEGPKPNKTSEPVDRIYVYPVKIQFPRTDTSVKITAVPASQLRSHFANEYGDDVPHNAPARQLTSGLFDAIAKVSTNPTLGRTPTGIEGIKRFLAVKASLVSRLINSASTVGDYIGERFDELEASLVRDLERFNDITFTIGALHLSTFVVASELGIDHPHYGKGATLDEIEAVTPKGRDVIKSGSSEEEREAIARLLSMSAIPRTISERIHGLQQTGTDVINRTDHLWQRLLDLGTDQQGDDAIHH